MLIPDGKGVIFNIIYGTDQRTQIQPGTHNVIYTTYTPAEITEKAVTEHLQDIQEYVRLFAPDARTEMLQIFE